MLKISTSGNHIYKRRTILRKIEVSAAFQNTGGWSSMAAFKSDGSRHRESQSITR